MTESTNLGQLIEQDGGSIKTGPFGTTLKASEYSETGVPIISVGEVGYGSLILRGDTPCAPTEVSRRLPEYLLETGDIVFGRKGAVDRSAWVKESENGWFLGSDGIRVRLPSSVDSRFVAYQFQSEATKTWLLQHASGSTMLSLNQRILARVPLNLPKLAEQRAIAEVLGALDDKIAANTKLVEVADGLAASLTRKGLDATKVVPLSSIAEIVMGSSPPGSSFNEIGEGTVFYQGVRDFGVRFPHNRVWTTSPVRLAIPGDTLLSVRAPVGRVNLATEKTCIGRGVASVRSSTNRPFTLFHLLKDSRDAWAPFEAEGTVFGSINKEQLASLSVPSLRPELEGQLEEALAPIERAIVSALNENLTLAATRDALLPQLMSWKLRVKEAEELVAAAV